MLTDPPKPVITSHMEELNLFHVKSTESSKLSPIIKSSDSMTGICWTSYVVRVQGLLQKKVLLTAFDVFPSKRIIRKAIVPKKRIFFRKKEFVVKNGESPRISKTLLSERGFAGVEWNDSVLRKNLSSVSERLFVPILVATYICYMAFQAICGDQK